MGGSNHDFWKNSSKDLTKLGYGEKQNKVVPIGGTKSLAETLSRVGTAQEKTQYDKERDRDPAVQMAAMNYRKLHQLRDESKDSRFSCLFSTADTILDTSNSHPSFRLYYAFVKRFMITMFIVCLLGNSLLAYNATSDWYDSKDIKFGLERTTLGNIDGMDYQSEGSYSSAIGKDNADMGMQMTLGVDLTITLFLIMFTLYQIYIFKLELRAKYAPISVRDYAVRVSGIPKNCEKGVEREIQKQFIRFGKIVEIVPVRNYTKALQLEMDIKKVAEKIGDRKAKDSILGQNSQRKINNLISQEQKLNTKQKQIYNEAVVEKVPQEVIVVFETVQNRNSCLHEFSKYSHWYSKPHSNMPNDLRLHGKYAYKVTDAPEPFDYAIENWYSPRWIPWVIFGLVFSLIFTGCCLALALTIQKLDNIYDKIPIYTECTKYYFASVTASTYLSASATNEPEVSCYCRHVGYDIVSDSSGDTKTLCQYWLDYFTDYYLYFTLVIGIMLAINVLTTYVFKLVFQSQYF